MRPLRAVVFDLDDTIYPERDYVMSGFRTVASYLTRLLGCDERECFSELQSLFDEGARRSAFDRWLEMRGIDDPTLVPTLISIYRNHVPDITPSADALALLHALRARYLLGVITDGSVEVQSRKLDSLGIRPLLDEAIVTSELGESFWKPNPLAFKVMLERFGVDPDAAVYVADNPMKDFLGARRAGMRSIRFRGRHGLYADLEPSTPEHAPDEEIRDLADLPSALERLRSADPLAKEKV